MSPDKSIGCLQSYRIRDFAQISPESVAAARILATAKFGQGMLHKKKWYAVRLILLHSLVSRSLTPKYLKPTAYRSTLIAEACPGIRIVNLTGSPVAFARRVRRSRA